MIAQQLPLALANAIIIYAFYWSALFDWRNDPANASAIDYEKIRESDVDDESKMIFWWVRFYSLKWLGPKWSKPLITCPVCMSSVHSIYVYWHEHQFKFLPMFNVRLLTFDLLFSNLYPYALHILMTAGICAIIMQFEKE